MWADPIKFLRMTLLLMGRKQLCRVHRNTHSYKHLMAAAHALINTSPTLHANGALAGDVQVAEIANEVPRPQISAHGRVRIYQCFATRRHEPIRAQIITHNTICALCVCRFGSFWFMAAKALLSWFARSYPRWLVNTHSEQKKMHRCCRNMQVMPRLLDSLQPCHRFFRSCCSLCSRCRLFLHPYCTR